MESMKTRSIWSAVLAICVSGGILGGIAGQAAAAENEARGTERVIQEIEQALSDYTPVQEVIANDIYFDEYAPILQISQSGEVSSKTGEKIGNQFVSDRIHIAEDDQLLKTELHNASITTGSTSTGAQSIITIDAPDAQTSYSFDLGLNELTHMVMDDDGSVDILTSENELVGEVKKPWAVDANGQSINTWFELNGNTLIQHVNLAEATAFPVVADPEWWQTTGTAIACTAELAAIAVPGAKLAAAISKSERIIKSSKTLLNAYNKLGGNVRSAVDKIRNYFFDKRKIDPATARAVEELLQKGGSALVNALGIGSCYNLGVWYLGWPSFG